MLRFNADYPNDWTQISESRTGYNTDGSVIFAYDALGHQTTFDYSDNFSDGGNGRGTNAYPTTVIDPDGYHSTAQYDYTTGAITATSRPSSGTNAQGNVTYETHALLYDWLARLQRDTNQNNGFYTRYVYTSDMLALQSFSNVRPDLSEDVSVEVFDGAGRLSRTATYMPGSITNYSGRMFYYNSMGQVAQWTNPTEMDANWNAAGPDAPPQGFGWVSTSRTYDWNGRPRVTTNPDNSTTELSYGGCGCAGGEVVTQRDERGRLKKLYNDTLGRLSKVEELSYDSTVYSTTTYTYNARDQLTQSNQQGQIRSFHYDGHGRLDSRTTPEQGTTTYAYNPDDTLNVLTDARGATQTFGYTGRHLVSSITFGVPGGVAATPNVTFAYDAAGDRISMTEKNSNNVIVGSSTYHYDSLSRMDWEQRTFDAAGPFTINYGYNNAGLASVTNPWGSQAAYSIDHTGATTSITGSGPVSASVYAQSLQYRASGGLKYESFGNGRALSVGYDNRLRVQTWDVPGVMGWSYAYTDFGENTGRVTFAQNLYDSTLTRSYDYDNVGRLFNSYTGPEALAHTGRPGGVWGDHSGPYSQAYIKDAWGNVTQKMGRSGDPDQFTATYTNNRQDGFTYDASGNLTFDLGQWFTYDATGQQATASYSGYSLANSYDGDRLRVKKAENGAVTYYLRSSVLGGQVVAEINSGGGWQRGYVYGAGGEMLATQWGGVVSWLHQDPATKSQRVTDSSGNVTAIVDLDPWGLETARSWNSQAQPHRYTSYERDGNQSDEAGLRRYNRWHLRFDQPDPYGGSYDLVNPQSFNRYAYVADDPVNSTDPSGMMANAWDSWDTVSIGFWGMGSLMNRSRGMVDDGSGGRFYDLPTGLLNVYFDDFRISNDLFGGERALPITSVLDGWNFSWGGYTQRRGPPIILHRGDKWYGYDNQDFHKWFHKCWKQPGDADASKEEIEEAYQEWVSRGRPAGGNCYGGRGRRAQVPDPVPVERPLHPRFNLERIPNNPPLSWWERLNRWLDNNIPPPPQPPPWLYLPSYPILIPVGP